MKKGIAVLVAVLLFIGANAQAPGIQWEKSLGGTGYDFATSIQQTTDGGYIVAGYSDSTNGDVTGNHGTNYWIVKLSPDVGIEENTVENSFNIFPNPASTQLSIINSIHTYI